MKIVYIGLGSNLDHPAMQIHEAVDRIAHIPGILVKKVSSLYRSKPMGLQDQPDFINAVAEIHTNLSAEALLNFLQRIEIAQKRIRSGKHWGPRTIDLDILLFGNDVIKVNGLHIPHPGLSEREFVVYPLAEIAPNLNLPSGQRMMDLKAQCPMRGLTLLSIEKKENEAVG